jgi:hypothetical protein
MVFMFCCIWDMCLSMSMLAAGFAATDATQQSARLHLTVCCPPWSVRRHTDGMNVRLLIARTFVDEEEGISPLRPERKRQRWLWSRRNAPIL